MTQHFYGTPKVPATVSGGMNDHGEMSFLWI